jgi:TatD DNase family protein
MNDAENRLIDTHTHLDGFYRKGQLESVLAAAREAGVDKMITIGTEPEDWDLYRTLSSNYPEIIHYSVGLHPCSVDEKWELAVAQLDSYEGLPSLVALGEIGLDRFHLPKKDIEKAEEIFVYQRSAFEAQLEIAKKWGMPVVIHSRGAFDETVAMIDQSGVDWSKVVFHCFSEGPDKMKALNDRGGRGSFTGIITYKNAEEVRQAALSQGSEKFMVETDAPYLAPVPHRGKMNEPAFVSHTAEFSAEVFGVSFAELARISTRNAIDFFGL